MIERHSWRMARRHYDQKNARTNRSFRTRAGVRYALAAARDLDAEVTIYHVVTADEMKELGDSLKGHAFSANLLKNYMHTYEANLAQFVDQNFSDLVPSVKVDEKVEAWQSG